MLSFVDHDVPWPGFADPFGPDPVAVPRGWQHAKLAVRTLAGSFPGVDQVAVAAGGGP